jgi:hypothetical protein
LAQIPATGDLLNSSAMPLAVVVQPLALLEPGEDCVPVVDFGDSGPIRCGRCKAYLNPFMRFLEGGRRFQCNLCAFVNPVLYTRTRTRTHIPEPRPRPTYTYPDLDPDQLTGT